MTWLLLALLYVGSATLFYFVATKTAATEPVALYIDAESADLDQAA